MIDFTDCVVDNHLNDILCLPFSVDEVKRAVFDLHPSKAPGSDGFTALFYQKLWPVEGPDIILAALAILNDKGDLTEWNSTLITVIPKGPQNKIVCNSGSAYIFMRKPLDIWSISINRRSHSAQVLIPRLLRTLKEISRWRL